MLGFRKKKNMKEIKINDPFQLNHVGDQSLQNNCTFCQGSGEVPCEATYESTWYGGRKLVFKQRCVPCDGTGRG